MSQSLVFYASSEKNQKTKIQQQSYRAKYGLIRFNGSSEMPNNEPSPNLTRNKGTLNINGKIGIQDPETSPAKP